MHNIIIVKGDMELQGRNADHIPRIGEEVTVRKSAGSATLFSGVVSSVHHGFNERDQSQVITVWLKED